MELVEHFEAARPRLVSLAHRIVGSYHDAEDAVQTAWTRVQAADTTAVTNLALPRDWLSADEAFLRREDVSRALLVLLAELSPKQRVAYVLHDLFSVPFEQIAATLDTNQDAAKKLASRARAKLRNAQPVEHSHSAEAIEIVEAFLAAAKNGDIARLVTLMAPDTVRTADPRLLPAGSRTEVRGATAIAEETKTFVDRISAAAPAIVAGRPGVVIAPGGHPYALIGFHIQAGLITGIDITPYTPGVLALIRS